MTITTGELNFARSWIGDETIEDDDTFIERFDRHYDQVGDQDRALALAIEEAMRARLTSLTQGPASLTLPGGLSMSYGQNMTTIMAALRDFRQQKLGAGETTRIRRSSMR